MPKDLPGGYGKDRIVVMVRDPYWLHAYWELTRQAVSRAEAALGQDWHGAKPILRLLDVTSHDSTSNAAEAILRDIEIHGGCNNWYIDVSNPPRSYRIDIGYLSRKGQFYVLARSNVVTTPRAGISDTIDENWADIDAKKADRIYAMSGGFDPSMSSLELKQLFEERLRRPLGSPSITSFGSGAMLPSKATEVLVPARRRVDRLWCHRAERPRHPARRTRQAAARWHLHHAFQPARQPANHSRRRRLCRRHRGADHRAGRGAEHQRARANGF